MFCVWTLVEDKAKLTFAWKWVPGMWKEENREFLEKE